MLSSNNTNGYLRFGMLGAMLIINPAVTEQQTKGNTPRVDCRPLIPEGAHSKFCFRPLRAVAFAYAHVTRRGHFGQLTEHLQVEGSALE